eukprot:EG_transcript_12066
MSYALIDEDDPGPEEGPAGLPRGPHSPRVMAAVHAAVAAALVMAAAAAQRPSAAPMNGRFASPLGLPRGRSLQTVSEAIDWALLGLLEAFPAHPLFPRIVDMPMREMYAVFGLRAAEFFHLVFGGDSDFQQQFLTQCGQGEVAVSQWEKQCRELRYRPRSFMPRKSTLEYQRYAFLSPTTVEAVARAQGTVVASASESLANCDGVFTFSTGLDGSEAIARGPHHLLLHSSTYFGDAQLAEMFRTETVFEVLEHPPETTAASPMVEVFIRYGLNVVRGGRQQSKMASVEQKQLEEQTAMLRKWVEMVNERVNLYLKAMGRMQPGAVAKSPPAPWDVHGAKHFMVTDIPSRWKTPRGPCLWTDLGTSDEEADRKCKASAGKQKNRFLRSLLGGAAEDSAAFITKPNQKPAGGRPKDKEKGSRPSTPPPAMEAELVMSSSGGDPREAGPPSLSTS